MKIRSASALLAAMLLAGAGLAQPAASVAPAPPAAVDTGAPAPTPVIGIPVSAEPKLKVGDAAPAAVLGKVHRGPGMSGAFVKGRVYVLDLCSQSFQQTRVGVEVMNACAARHKDKPVTFVGVLVDAARVTIPAWLESLDAPPTYTIAEDGEGFPTATAYIVGAKSVDPPACFIVDARGEKPVLAWHGPTPKAGPIIDAVMAGTFDMMKVDGERRAAEAVLTAEQKQIDALAPRVRAAMAAKEWDAADAALQEVAKISPRVAKEVEIDRVIMLMAQKKDLPATRALVARLVAKDFADEPDLLQRLGQQLVFTELPAAERDLDGGEKVAQRLIVLKHQVPLDYAMLAKVAYDRGKLAEVGPLLDKAKSAAGKDTQMLEIIESFRGELQAGGAEKKAPEPAPVTAPAAPADAPVVKEPAPAAPPK
ncbi:hypothetical protein BH11PLA1_BH11PLA1_20840 [soil metagenome]